VKVEGHPRLFVARWGPKSPSKHLAVGNSN
jgi:hypothetical protein